jgi:hypothetical protein
MAPRPPRHDHVWYPISWDPANEPTLYACSGPRCILTRTETERIQDENPERWDAIRPRCGADTKGGKTCRKVVVVHGFRCNTHGRVNDDG